MRKTGVSLFQVVVLSLVLCWSSAEAGQPSRSKSRQPQAKSQVSGTKAQLSKAESQPSMAELRAKLQPRAKLQALGTKQQSCGYVEIDQGDGGLCIYSWCGSSCQAYDCVFGNGSEWHEIHGC